MAWTVLARHGAHEKNVLTDEGVAEVISAAELVGYTFVTDEVTTVRVVHSEEARAAESAKLYRAVLLNLGLEVTNLGPDARLNPAKGLGTWADGKHSPCPKYGDGAVAYWKSLDLDSLPEGIESYNEVGGRVRDAMVDHHARGAGRDSVLFVFHGGAIEPAVDALNATIIPDLPSAAVVAWEIDGLFGVFDPNAYKGV